MSTSKATQQRSQEQAQEQGKSAHEGSCFTYRGGGSPPSPPALSLAGFVIFCKAGLQNTTKAAQATATPPYLPINQKRSLLFPARGGCRSVPCQQVFSSYHYLSLLSYCASSPVVPALGLLHRAIAVAPFLILSFFPFSSLQNFLLLKSPLSFSSRSSSRFPSQREVDQQRGKT